MISSVEDIENLLNPKEDSLRSELQQPQQMNSIPPKDYAGDFDDKTATPIDKEGKDSSTFQTLDFADPAELVAFFDSNISSGAVTLHKWQNDLHEQFAEVKPTAQHPLRFTLVAANGSGKDLFIVAPFAIWFTLTKIQSRCIITSSSGTQLTAQTEGYIRNLAEKVNKFFNCEIFRIRQRYIKCRLSGSEIRLFATDEAGKAEGYHPITPLSEMAIIINESKSVSEEIHKALTRCSGFNYWIEVSTPGEPRGSFYRTATDKENINLTIDTIPLMFSSGSYVLTITSYDCPHISMEEIERDKRLEGEHSALFRSKHLALFTSLGGEVIISLELINKLLTSPPSIIYNLRLGIGIDIAAGGDENSITFSKGSKCLKEYQCRERDTTITADWIERILLDNSIKRDYDYIFADDGGIGHAVIDTLIRKGWNIHRRMNQWKAINSKQFGNIGAESWYRVKRLFEEEYIDVRTLGDKTINQLTTRQYKQNAQGGRIFLESKKEAKAHGRPSPDRADSYILSMTGLTVEDFEGLEGEENKVKSEGMSMEDMIEYYRNEMTYGGKYVEKSIGQSAGQRIFCSLRAAMDN